MTGKYIGSILFLIIITGAIFFSNLGGIPLLDPDEPVYAETPREMIQFADYLSPRIYGEYWYDKPPMYYWLVAGSFKLFGVNEFAARFPSALLAIVGILGVFQAAAKFFELRAGLISGLILGTSIEYFYLAKAAVTDLTLCLFITLALLAYIQRKYYLFYFFAGLATLAKGPVGLIFPATIVFLYLLTTRQLSELLKIKILLGIVIYSAVAMLWYYLMYDLHGSIFLNTFIGFHNLTRFASPEHPEGLLWYYFIPVLFVGFFPWIAILPEAIWKALTEGGKKYNILLFLNIWAWFIFVFFSISQTKLVSYILPMFPPLAMIVGWYVDQLWEGRAGARHRLWGVSLTKLTLLFIAGMFYGSKKMPEIERGLFVEAGILVVMLLAFWFYYKRRQVSGMFWSQVAAMSVFSVILVTILLPVVANNFSAHGITKHFTANYDGKSSVYIIKFLHPGFTFYSGVYGQELKSEAELTEAIKNSRIGYFVVRENEYKHLNDAERSLFTVVAEEDKKMLLKKQEVKYE